MMEPCRLQSTNVPNNLIYNLNENASSRINNSTLHIGATRIAPAHESGCFKCTFRATAPPIDCPNKKLGRVRNSGFSTTRKTIQLILLKYFKKFIRNIIQIARANSTSQFRTIRILTEKGDKYDRWSSYSYKRYAISYHLLNRHTLHLTKEKC